MIDPVTGIDDGDETPETAPAPDYQASLETARSNGYDWASIWNWIAQGTTTAADYGYTQGEIDTHLGFKDPSAFEDRARTSWTAHMAADPKAIDDLAKPEPKIDLTANPGLAGDYAQALLAGEVKGPQDFAERYAAQAIDAAHSAHGLDDADIDARLAAGWASATGLAAALPTREDLADATVAVGGD